MRNIIIATALFATTAAPALAAPAKDAPQPTANEAETGAPQKAETRYCVRQTFTGSRVPKKTCKTRDQWIEENEFDPLAPDSVTR